MQLGREWGVGDKAHNNGVVILIKPKNDTEGRVTIQVGYGLEGVLPDAFCSKIIEKEKKPSLADGDYRGAVRNAVRVIIPVAKGEYSEQQYGEDTSTGELLLWSGILVVVIILAIFGSKIRRRGSSGSSGDDDSYSSNGGYDYDDDSSSDSLDYGGGSFGGGGASSSW